LSWTATASTEGGAPWRFQSLTGTVHFDHDGAPEPPEPPCDATLSERPGGEDFVSVAPPEAVPARSK
ncbi:MAG: hypothetical protein JSS97_21080, partial [Actinobacteria bacterium]|nr:hypothetical protein [Actinomycetota bacterium]